MVSPNKLPIVKSAAQHACLQRFSRSRVPNKLPIVKSAARHACLQGFSRSGVPSKLPIAKKCGGGEVRFVRMRQRAVEIFQHAFCVGVFRVLLQLRGKAGAHAAGHPALPRGEYQLSQHVGDRCVYTFCMCPGGQVVASASETGHVVTNGMSYHARDGKNANAAVVVSVGAEDFAGDPRRAIAFHVPVGTKKVKGE